MRFHRHLSRFFGVAISLATACTALATSTYEYKPGEYVVITDGKSPNGEHSIAAHGEGEYGDENFHLYLMDAKSGKRIGPLEEVKDTLDTGADAFTAKWSADSSEVSIVIAWTGTKWLRSVIYRRSPRASHQRSHKKLLTDLFAAPTGQSARKDVALLKDMSFRAQSRNLLFLYPRAEKHYKPSHK